MNENIKLKIEPAPTGERYDFGNGVSLSVTAHAVNNEYGISLPVFDTMSDYKWQLNGLRSRIKNPTGYATSEDVEAVKRHLMQWLTDNEPEPQESYLKAEFNALITELA